MWGDQTWEEMAVAFFEVARPRLPTHGQRHSDASAATDSGPSEKAQRYAASFLKEMDKNRDGTVELGEASNVVRTYSFYRLDRDGDGKITRDELIQAVDERRGR